MSYYVLGLLLAAVLSALLTIALSGWANKRGLFAPTVRERDIHQTPTPRIGGIAIVISFIVVVLFFQFAHPELLTFTGRTIFGIDQNLLGFILGVVLLSVINIWDDYRGVRWQVKLLTQIVAAALIVGFGIHIPWISNPSGGVWQLGRIAWLLVIIWLVTMSNVVNLLDGVNGLASGVSAIALITLYFLSISPAVVQKENALLAIIGFGAVIGFIPFNVGRARAFLGDTGAVFLGFLIGVLAIISGGKIATTFLVMAIPFLDAVFVIITRLVQKRSPFQADKQHLHHRLLQIGLKPWQIVGLFYLVSIFFGWVALKTQTSGKLHAAVAALALMVVVVVVYWYKQRQNNTHAS